MDIITKAEAMAKPLYEKHDPVHKWFHPMAVMKRALEIAKHFEDVDYEALKLAIILHDIVYDDYKTHVDESIAFAKKWLKEQKYPDERIKKVAEIMMNHSGPHRRKFGDAKLLEGKIIYDAEKSLLVKDFEKVDKYWPRFYLQETRDIVEKSVPFVTRIAAIIIKDNKLLMVKGKKFNDLWTPGGKVEPGESDQEALKREFKEELNADVIPGEFIGEYIRKSPYQERMVRTKVYLADVKGELKPAMEIESYFWVSREDFEKKRHSFLEVTTKDVIPALIEKGLF